MNQLRVLLSILLILNLYDRYATYDFKGKLKTKECPNVTVTKNVDKQKLLGVWYAYATTPLGSHNYQRRCSAYNVKGSPYFDTNILYTNYGPLLITYACEKKPFSDFYRIKLRILTRTRTPMPNIVGRAINYLKSIDFPVEKLEWLKNDAFCFEWYQLKFETQVRPIQYQAPFNKPDY